MKRILTYGTFDLLHYGHIRLLQRAKALGDYLIVAVSTDEFNALKGKKSYHNYETRKKMLEAIRYVDLVIPEDNWEQKIDDVKTYHVDVVVMGSDWAGSDRFEYLNDYEQIIDSIIGNERIEKLWNIYSNKYKYASGIDINQILNLLRDIIKKLDLEVVAV